MKRTITSILSFVFTLYLSGCSSNSTSIGIIGGADGPTAILVNSKMNWAYIGGLLGIIIVAILVVLIIRNKKKK